MTKNQEKIFVKNEDNLSELQICWNILKNFAQQQKQQLFYTNKLRVWRNIFIIFYIVTFVVLLVLKRLNSSFKESNLASRVFILFVLACLGIVLFELLSSRKIKNSREFKLERAQSNLFSGNDNQEFWYMDWCIKILSQIKDKTVLSILKRDLERIIEEKELKYKNLESFLLVLAVAFIYFLYNLLIGNFTEAILNNKIQIATIIFLTTIITSILKTLFYNNDIKYLIIDKRCKFLIEITDLIINNDEFSLRQEISVYNKPKTSLLNRLKKTKIQAPEDFSTNYHKYMNDKNETTDIS